MATKYPDRKAFKRVTAEIQGGQQLTFEQVGDVFGTQFWMLLVSALMDSNDAARAIQGAIQRLREEEVVN